MPSLMKNKAFLIINLCLILFLTVITVIFWISDLDVQLALIFYDSVNDRFVGHDFPLFAFFYYPGVVIFISLFGVFGIILLLYSFMIKRETEAKRQQSEFLRRQGWFLISVLAIGIVLIIFVIIKNVFAHPRPNEVIQHGATYYPPFSIAIEFWGESNMSFPCGHCSTAWGLLAFYFAYHYAPKLWQKILKYGVGIVGGLVCGIIMTLTRLSAGGHFLSDGIWSAAFIYFTILVLYYSFGLNKRESKIKEFYEEGTLPLVKKKVVYMILSGVAVILTVLFFLVVTFLLVKGGL